MKNEIKLDMGSAYKLELSDVIAMGVFDRIARRPESFEIPIRIYGLICGYGYIIYALTYDGVILMSPADSIMYVNEYSLNEGEGVMVDEYGVFRKYHTSYGESYCFLEMSEGET